MRAFQVRVHPCHCLCAWVLAPPRASKWWGSGPCLWSLATNQGLEGHLPLVVVWNVKRSLLVPMHTLLNGPWITCTIQQQSRMRAWGQPLGGSACMGC